MEDESSNYTPCLPNDIIFQVLRRLAVKTLVRFCCVCKSWQNLITSDQIFIKSHLQNQSPSNFFMYNWINVELCRCNKFPDIDIQRFVNADHQEAILSKSVMYVGMQMYLVGSTNGLLCFYKKCGCGWDSRIYLWNPALRQCKLLPRSTGKFYRNIVVGFDYDPMTDDHKMVRVSGVVSGPGRSINSYNVGIYSLRSHSWKTIRFNSIPIASIAPPAVVKKGVIYQGFLYWVPERYVDGHVWLNAFDITREIFQEIVVPSYVPINLCPRIRLFKGCLSICGSVLKPWERSVVSVFELWVMEEHGANSNRSNNSWVKQFAIPTGFGIQPATSPTDVMLDGKIFAQCPLENEPNGDTPRKRLVLYNPETQKLEDLQNGCVYYHTENFDYLYEYFLVDNYVESLISVVAAGENEFPVETPNRDYSDVAAGENELPVETPDRDYSDEIEEEQNGTCTFAQKFFGYLCG